MPSQALEATELDGQKLDEGLELLAKISDPAHKQERHGAMYEGRELFVSNIPWSATWKQLKQLFAQFGSVEGARVPKKVDGSSKGIGYVVYRHKEDALKGLALNMTSWNGRIINVVESTNDAAKRHVSIVTSKSQRTTASPAPEPSFTNGETHSPASPKPPASNKREDIQSRTLALLNVPDTINDARVRALVEPYGDLVRVVLRPDHQGAIVEYKDQPSVGKAALALEGHAIAPDRTLRVGTVEEMKQLRAEKRDGKIAGASRKSTTALPTPTLVRRPGTGAGRRGGRGGLGLKREGKESATIGGRVTETDAVEKDEKQEHGSKPKSNADFKAMMLRR